MGRIDAQRVHKGLDVAHAVARLVGEVDDLLGAAKAHDVRSVDVEMLGQRSDVVAPGELCAPPELATVDEDEGLALAGL